MPTHRPLGAFIAVLALCQVVALGYLHAEPPSPVPTAGATAPPGPDPAPVPARPLVGAHYHVWYPSNFDQGFLRAELDPPQSPALGRYDSGDPAVAAAQIAAASAHGIDFFTVDWWPSRPEQNKRAIDGFLRAPNLGDIGFAVFYEAWDLGFDPATGTTPMDADTGARFAADMELLADTFFAHPSYLRIHGRPVLIVYLSRTMTGDVAGAIGAARDRLRQRGIDVFLIGDEVFWWPMEPERMRLFDAITAYNLYAGHEMPQHAGYPSQTSLVEDHLALYRRHAEASGVPIGPGVLPGYNDRGVRPVSDHYAIPRRWAPDRPEGSTLRELIDRIARPSLDPRLPMLLVTSWNEWNEDTAIEPLAPAAETPLDRSSTGDRFTQGYAYGGGDVALRALRDEVVAVAGRVVEAGRPRAGVRVEARDVGGGLLAADVSDSAGRFTLSRWLVPPGPVIVSAGASRATVAADPDRTAEIDLALVELAG